MGGGGRRLPRPPWLVLCRRELTTWDPARSIEVSCYVQLKQP